MNLLDELRALGVDVDDGLKRLMGNEKLYRRLLGSFVKMIATQAVDPDFDENDYQEAIEKAHSIKGTAGNLSLTPIFEAYSEILNLLRTEKPAEAKAVLAKVLPVQQEIISCIEKNME
ncbi:MAG: Hpt domain-containing protein [Lachnospiraceae bacterium]|nr:Hpt domain-containing protein [Lachnospiraceae bacterium]